MVKRTLGPCKPEVKDTAYNMLVRPKLEYASPIWNPHTSSQINRLERIQHYTARFVANDHRRTTSPTTLVLTLNWQTLERRRTIKQAMTYKILNNIIEINPPTGLLTRSHNRHHFTIPRSRLNTVHSILILPQSHRLIQGPVHPSFGLVKCTAGRVYPSNSASWTGNNPSKVH